MKSLKAEVTKSLKDGKSGIECLGATLAIRGRHPHLRNSSPVAVPLVTFKADLFAEYQGAHPFLGPLSEGLSFFGSIDSGKANLVLAIVCIEHSDGIAVD